MILPGPKMMVGGKKDIYTPAIEAITGKTLYVRADKSTAAVNSTLNTNNWDNEAIATPDISGSALWRDNQQNGLRGVDSGSNRSVNTQRTLNNLMGSGRTFTFFAVERRTGGGVSDNSKLLEGLHVRLAIDSSTTNFEARIESDYGGVEVPLGASYTSGAAYVFALAVNSIGTWRLNFNNTIYTGSGFEQPWTKTGTCSLGLHGSGACMVFEYIMSSNPQTDAVVDAAVDALMEKWGIA